MLVPAVQMGHHAPPMVNLRAATLLAAVTATLTGMAPVVHRQAQHPVVTQTVVSILLFVFLVGLNLNVQPSRTMMATVMPGCKGMQVAGIGKNVAQARAMAVAAAAALARTGDGAPVAAAKYAVMALWVAVPITKAAISSKPLALDVMGAYAPHQAHIVG